MGKSISAGSFSRLFRESITPIYFLDKDQTLVYFNHALSELTACEPEKLIGQVCRYHTPTSRMHQEIIAAALAPPPEVLAGKSAVGVVTIDAIRKIHRRRAEFRPIPLGNDQFGTLVLLGMTDMSEKDASALYSRESRESAETTKAQELHQLLFSLRRYQSGLYSLDRFVGNSPQIALAREQAKLAAESSAPVLILGPAGSGKESLAQAIHYGKDREQSGGLIPIDCFALPTDLIESAIRAFYNRYEKATESKCHTLFLTHIDRLPLELEPLVCSLLAGRSKKKNIRIIGTSHLPPGEWESLKELPHLLGVITIRLPALAERKKDIPLLAQWFLEQQNLRKNPQKTGFSSDAMDMLMLYHWPKNLEELQEIVAQAHAAAKEPIIRKTEIPIRLHHAQQAKTVHVKKVPIVMETFLRDIELELIQRAMKTSRDNKAEAARLLGISRPKLYRRMEQLGLIEPQTPDFRPIDEA